MLRAIGIMLVLAALEASSSAENVTARVGAAKVSRFKVMTETIEGLPTRRKAFCVRFQVVEVLDDAFASEPPIYNSPGEQKRARAKRGSPVGGKLGARIFLGSDVQNDEDSITRLLRFLGVAGEDLSAYHRHDGPYEFPRKRVYVLTVRHAKDLSSLAWELVNDRGGRVELKPYNGSP